MSTYTDKNVNIKFMNYYTDLKVASVVSTTYGTSTLDVPSKFNLTDVPCNGSTFVTVDKNYQTHNSSELKKHGLKCQPEFVKDFVFLQSIPEILKYMDDHTGVYLFYIGYTQRKLLNADVVSLQIAINPNQSMCNHSVIEQMKEKEERDRVKINPDRYVLDIDDLID